MCQPPDSPRPPSRGLPRLIVCERKGRWASALRVFGGMERPVMLETRSLADCTDAVRANPGSFVLLELTARNAAALLAWLAELDRLDPKARAAVAADGSMRSWEWVAREAGAVWFVTSPREVRPVAGMARRHLQAVPKPQRELVEELWDSLPWARY